METQLQSAMDSCRGNTSIPGTWYVAVTLVRSRQHTQLIECGAQQINDTRILHPTPNQTVKLINAHAELSTTHPQLLVCGAQQVADTHTNSSTSAVVRCVVSVGGAVWADKQSDSLSTHGAQAL